MSVKFLFEVRKSHIIVVFEHLFIIIRKLYMSILIFFINNKVNVQDG